MYTFLLNLYVKRCVLTFVGEIRRYGNDTDLC